MRHRVGNREPRHRPRCHPAVACGAPQGHCRRESPSRATATRPSAAPRRAPRRRPPACMRRPRARLGASVLRHSTRQRALGKVLLFFVARCRSALGNRCVLVDGPSMIDASFSLPCLQCARPLLFERFGWERAHGIFWVTPRLCLPVSALFCACLSVSLLVSASVCLSLLFSVVLCRSLAYSLIVSHYLSLYLSIFLLSYSLRLSLSVSAYFFVSRCAISVSVCVCVCVFF